MLSRSLAWRIIGLAAAAALASCAVGPDFHQPNPPDTSGYLHPSSDTAPVQPQAQDVQNISPGAELAGEWWRLFHSAQLDEVVRAAIAASPTLVAANATLAEAREEVTVARGAFLPSVSATRRCATGGHGCDSSTRHRRHRKSLQHRSVHELQPGYFWRHAPRRRAATGARGLPAQ